MTFWATVCWTVDRNDHPPHPVAERVTAVDEQPFAQVRVRVA